MGEATLGCWIGYGVAMAVSEIVLTVAGGVIGAAIQNHLSKHPERRASRAAVMDWVHKVEDASQVLQELSTAIELKEGMDAPAYVDLLHERYGETRTAEKDLSRALDSLEVAALAAGVPWKTLELYRRATTVVGHERAVSAKVQDLLGNHDEMLGAYYRTAILTRAADKLLRDALRKPWRSRLVSWWRGREVAWLADAAEAEGSGWDPQLDAGRTVMSLAADAADRTFIRAWKRTWKERLRMSARLRER